MRFASKPKGKTMLFQKLNETDADKYRQWAHDNHCAGDRINTVWHPVIRAECAKINAQNGKCANGTHYLGAFKMPYAELVSLIGKPNGGDDGYKVDAEWIFDHNGDVATVYNWKNGPNYTGRGSVEELDEWHIGGHDIIVANNLIHELLINRRGTI
jgi:hypothetical protein